MIGAFRNGRSRNLNFFEGGAATPELDRRFNAHKFLDPSHNKLGPAAQLLNSVWVPQQGEHAVGD
jgi:hypothetical protein